MSITILVRKHSARPRFKPHFNSAMGKYVGTRSDYLKTMRSMGLEPQRDVKRAPPKPYKTTQWARDMVKSAVGSDGKVRVGSRFIEQIKERCGGFKPVPQDVPQGPKATGGFYNPKEGGSA